MSLLSSRLSCALRVSVAGLTPEEVQKTVTQILRSLGVSGEDAEVREEVFVELMMQMDAYVASVFDAQGVHDHDDNEEDDEDEGESEEVEAVQLSDEDLQALFDDLVQQETDASAANKSKKKKESNKKRTVSEGTLLQWTALKELVDSGDVSVSSLQQLLRRLSVSAASEEARLDLDGFKALCRQILEHNGEVDEMVDEEDDDEEDDDEEEEGEYEEVDEEEIRSAFDEMLALQQQDERRTAASSSKKRSSSRSTPPQTPPLLSMETMKRHWPLLQQVLEDEMLTEQSLVRILDSIAHPEDDHTSPPRSSDEVRALSYEGFAEFYRLLVDATEASKGDEEEDVVDVEEQQDVGRVGASKKRPAAVQEEDDYEEEEDGSEV